MTIRSRSWSQRLARAIRLLLVLSFVNLLPGRPPTASARTQGIAGQAGKASTRTAGGLHTITFDTLHGRVIVHLPDDMRAGDTISGTVVAEPKGSTEEERPKNLDALKGYLVEIGDQKVSTPHGSFTWIVPDTPVKLIRIIEISSGKEVANTPVPTQAAVKSRKGYITMKGGDAIAAQPEPADDIFQLPTLGQQGRPIEIFGPFDGSASNTTLRFVPVGSTVQDFEKGTESVSGGFGLIRPLAESPRKLVFESPTKLTGPVELLVKEGNTETKGIYRNLGVQLSAPKTNLMRGERTTLTIEVRGLEGIRTDVPLQLDAKGVIQMDGGNFQNLRIRPQEVQPDGRYITTRAITGQQAGAFTCTATVIVRPFDICLSDDINPHRRLLWNTFTGDYVFTNPGPAGQTRPPGGTVQPGGTGQTGGTTQTGSTGQGKPTDTVTPSPPTGLNLTGLGKPAMKGCIITLSHNAPDRRVFARLDTCSTTGSAEVQTNSPKTNSNIKDSNTADNVCQSK